MGLNYESTNEDGGSAAGTAYPVTRWRLATVRDEYNITPARPAHFDTSRLFLGPLCKRSHDFAGSGYSLRLANRGDCVECERARNHARSRTAITVEHKRFVSMRYNNRQTRPQEKYTFAQLSQHFERFAGCCAYCGASVRPCDHCGSTLVQWDHYEPGGIDALSNLVPTCQRCNISKFNRPADRWFPDQPFYTTVRDAAIREILSNPQYAQRRRWSRDHDACQACGTTERAHASFGFCVRCAQADYRRRKGAVR